MSDHEITGWQEPTTATDNNPHLTEDYLDEPESVVIPETIVDPEQSSVHFQDDDVVTQASTDDKELYDEIMRSLSSTPEEDRGTINLDNILFGVAMSDIPDLDTFQRQRLIDHRDNFEGYFRDAGSDYYTIDSAARYLTDNQQHAVNQLKATDVTKLSPSVRGLGDATASLFKRYKAQEHVKLSGSDGLLAFTSLTGGVRRTRLYNSGMYLSFRNIPLIDLHEFYTEFNNQDYEYGKEFGGFYYTYSDLFIRKYIIEHLFPLAMCGSNYIHWRDNDRLLGSITCADFDAIMLTLGLMMHPDGVDIGFTCAAPGCGHITKEKVDLSKLRLNNGDLINDDMFEILTKSGWLTDDDLQSYRTACRMNKTIEFSYGKGVHLRKWKITLRQATLLDWLSVGEDFITELRKSCDVKKQSAVKMYLLYNDHRALKPWIDTVQLTVIDPDTGAEKVFETTNDLSDDNTKTIYMLLDEFRANVPTFKPMVEEYIRSTQITHTCFYMPKCPACGAEPTTGYQGYLPYDPLRSFFILARTKLLQGM